MFIMSVVGMHISTLVRILLEFQLV